MVRREYTGWLIGVPILLAILAGWAWGGEPPKPRAIVGPTSPVEPGELVQLTLPGLSIDQAKKSVVSWYPRERVNTIPATTWDGTVLILFSAKVQGKYLIGVYSPATGGGVEKSEIEVTVGTSVNPPQPPDPVDPPVPAVQKLWLIVVEESSKRTPAEAQTHLALSKYAEEKGHSWHLQDRSPPVPEAFARFVQAAPDGVSTMFAVAASDGKILWQGKLPAKEEAVKTAKKYGGE